MGELIQLLNTPINLGPVPFWAYVVATTLILRGLCA